MSRKILILDSSQLSTYYECPTKHQLEYEEHLAISNEVSDPIAAGTMGHKLLEIYYSTGSPATALQIDIDELDVSDKEGFPLSAELRRKVLGRFRDYVMNYAHNDFKPLTRTEHQFRINEELLPYDTWVEVPLVEKGFSYELLNTPEYLFLLEGRIDVIADFQRTTAWVDHKFQFRARDLYSKSIQFRNYSLATGLSIGVINYIRMTQKIDSETFKRQPVSFSANDLKEWKQELTEKYIEIAKSGVRARNRGACEGKFGYECQFTRLCEEYNDQTRELIKVQNYVKRKEWTPWRLNDDK